MPSGILMSVFAVIVTFLHQFLFRNRALAFIFHSCFLSFFFILFFSVTHSVYNLWGTWTFYHISHKNEHKHQKIRNEHVSLLFVELIKLYYIENWNGERVIEKYLIYEEYELKFEIAVRWIWRWLNIHRTPEHHHWHSSLHRCASISFSVSKSWKNTLLLIHSSVSFMAIDCILFISSLVHCIYLMGCTKTIRK